MLMRKIIAQVARGISENKLLDVLCKGIIRGISAIPKRINRGFGILGRKILSATTPVEQNKVFFLPQEGKYVCNPKYISKELEKRRPDLDIVWRYQGNKYQQEIPESVRKVKLNSYEYFKEIFSSKVIVANSFLYVGLPYPLKKDQILIETWHGSLGIKRHDKDAMKDRLRKKALIKTGKLTTYCISNSALETRSLRETYWPNTPILEYGHARNDIFFENHKDEHPQIRNKIFEKYGLSESTHIVMYAPTFRDNKNFDVYDIDYERLLMTLEAKFGGEWCLFLRYHISLKNELKKNALTLPENDRIIDVTNYIDMQELILVTDVAITDYSSWIYDFILLRRPGFIFATDIEEYTEKERGFYYPLEDTPFSITTNNDELMEAIENFDPELYLPRVELFLQDKGCIEDGHASERVVDLIEMELKKN